ncbi:hypothetical protein GY45DRAFT_1328013 [Cubamyces sp. BRFM 1775]|nr:hypothetical protein GY45DRAFT_1328013 [Cubamyces sp. BRFM 1775]
MNNSSDPSRTAQPHISDELAAFVAGYQHFQSLPQPQPQVQAQPPPPQFRASDQSNASGPTNHPGLLSWQNPWQQPPNGASAFLPPSDTYHAPQASSSQNHPPHMAQWNPQFQSGVAPQPQPTNLQDSNALVASLLSTIQMSLTQQHQAMSMHMNMPDLLRQAHPRPSSSAPVGSMPDDEELIVDALRRCKNSGLTPRQALDSLDGVNNHSAAAWKDYFLDHMHRLHARSRLPRPDSLPTARRTEPRGEQKALSHEASPADSERNEGRSRPPPTIPRKQNVKSSSRKERAQSVSERSPSSKPIAATSTKKAPQQRSKRGPTFFAALPTGVRRRQASPVPMFHAGTRIPQSQTIIKPTPPTSEEGSGNRFTDAEKVFFIQYLQWRMRDDPTVTKDELCEELAEAIPQHDAGAWKRHWDKYPELPDQIFIEGRKGAARATRTHSGTTASDSDESQGSEDGEGETDSSGSDSESESEASDRASSPRPAAPVKTPAKRGRPRKQEVTEDDFRAMARYKFENRKTWHTYTSEQARWRDFASRPENAARRSLPAWVTIVLKRADELQAYYQEYVEEHDRQRPVNGRSKGHADRKPEDGGEGGGTPDGQREKNARTNASINGNGHAADSLRAPQIPRKRRAEEQVPDGSPTVYKRPKEDIKSENRDAL